MDFTIYISEDAKTFTQAVNGRLTLATNLGCNVPIQTFTLAKPTTARYIKFVANSYFNQGAGLNFISWAPPGTSK